MKVNPVLANSGQTRNCCVPACSCLVRFRSFGLSSKDNRPTVGVLNFLPAIKYLTPGSIQFRTSVVCDTGYLAVLCETLPLTSSRNYHQPTLCFSHTQTRSYTSLSIYFILPFQATKNIFLYETVEVAAPLQKYLRHPWKWSARKFSYHNPNINM